MGIRTDKSKEEKAFEKSLKANRRVAKKNKPLKPGQTHAEIEENGEKKIVRKRFSAK